MKIVRQESILNVAEKLSWFKNQIELENAVCLFNNNIGSEYFICGLMNLVYEIELINLNHSQKNFAGIDLGDEKSRIAVQITSDNSRVKVQNTINSFIKNKYEKKYTRLIVMVLGSRTRFNKDFDTQNKLSFDKKNDVIDIKQIIKDLDKCSDERIEEISIYLNQKLRISDASNRLRDCDDFINEEKRKVYALCLTKLKALGISKETGIAIIEDDLKNKNWDFLLDNGVKYLVGDFGSGKSHLLYEFTLILAEQYLEKSIDNFPVFIDASELSHDGSIVRFAEEKEIDLSKGIIIIDGLDEFDYSVIEKIINEVEYLETLYDEIKIVIGSRGMSNLAGKKTISMPLLSTQNINHLCRRITGDKGFRVENQYHKGKDAGMLKMLTKPFFTIIYAIYTEGYGGHLRNEMDLVSIFIDKALQPYLRRNPSVLSQLEQIAVLSIDRNYGYIHKSEMPINIDENELLKSGFLRLQQKDCYVFTLPIIAQWLGARAIRDKLIDIHEVIKEEFRIIKWRYSISILFSQMTYEESEQYFTYIVENMSGIAAIIVRDGINFDGTIDIQDERKNGERVYKCMQSWLKGIGTLSVTVGLVDGSNVNTLAISCSDDSLEFSWADTYLGVDVLIGDGKEDSTHFHTRCWRKVPAQATWPWVITFEYLSDVIKKGFEGKNWLVLDGAMENEFVWANTLKLMQKGSLYTKKIDINDVECYRTKKKQYSNIDLKTYFHLIDRLIEKQKRTIDVPYIVGDRELKSGYIWDCYSCERMKLRVENIYKSAFEEYQKLVDEFFKCFSGQLSTYMTLPCKLIGSLCYADSKADGSRPNMQYYLEALPANEKFSIEIGLNDRIHFSKDSKAIFESMKKKAREQRGDKSEYISFTIWGGACMNSSVTPVTDMVYKMLIEDLKRIGWLKS